MGATHVSSLLFCLFSFLFGAGMAFLHAALYGTLAALRLLPPVTGRDTGGEHPTAPRTAEGERGARSKEARPVQADGEAKEKGRSSAQATQGRDNGAAEIEAEKKKKKKGSRPFFFGYLLLDLFFFLLFAVCYLLFLFLWHDGVFRLYSLLLAALGAGLFHRVARTLVARPVAFLLSLPVRLLSMAFSRVLAFCRRKKSKQLDETDKIV